MSELDRDPLMLLYDVAHLLRVDADKRARANGMSRAQWLILVRISRQPGLSQKELAELLEVEPITVARLVDRLEARDMVKRCPDPRDRRIWRLRLGPAAEAILQTIATQRHEQRVLSSAGITPDAMVVLTEILLQMKANLVAEKRIPAREVA